MRGVRAAQRALAGSTGEDGQAGARRGPRGGVLAVRRRRAVEAAVVDVVVAVVVEDAGGFALRLPSEGSAKARWAGTVGGRARASEGCG